MVSSDLGAALIVAGKLITLDKKCSDGVFAIYPPHSLDVPETVTFQSKCWPGSKKCYGSNYGKERFMSHGL
jgi:hypothetical protein